MANNAHICDDTTITKAIMNHLARHPQEWDRLPWACLHCGQENPGIDMLCGRSACRDEMGSSRAFVLRNILSKVEQELASLQEVEDNSAQIWPVQKVIEVLLSPHNRTYGALLTGAFRAPLSSENCCECCTSTATPIITLRPTLTTLTLPPAFPLTTATFTPLASSLPLASPSHSPVSATPREPLQAQNVDNTVNIEITIS